jgi:hypothetical protein
VQSVSQGPEREAHHPGFIRWLGHQFTEWHLERQDCGRTEFHANAHSVGQLP